MKLLRASITLAGFAGFAAASPAKGQFFPQAQVPQPPPPDAPAPQPPMSAPAVTSSDPPNQVSGPQSLATQPQSLVQQVADLQSEVSTLQTVVADLVERLTSTGIGNTASQQGNVLFTNSPGKPIYCQMRLQSMDMMFSWIHEHDINKNNRNIHSTEIGGWFPVYYNCFDKRDGSPIPEPDVPEY